jgi:hypothetical protein
MQRLTGLKAIAGMAVMAMLLTLPEAGSTAPVADPPPQREAQMRRRLPPGVVEDRPIQGFEYEMAQAGGAGYGIYRSIGSLRCPADQAMVSVQVATSPKQIDYLRLGCAQVTCDTAGPESRRGGCSWSRAMPGPDAGEKRAAARATTQTCPQDSMISGLQAEVSEDNEAILNVAFECAPIAGKVRPSQAAGSRELYVLADQSDASTRSRTVPSGLGRRANMSASCRETGATALSVATAAVGASEKIGALSMFCGIGQCVPVSRVADYMDIRNKIYDTTIRQNSSVYFNIFERSQYYVGVDRMLGQHDGTRTIKFFAAAAQVTNPFTVGAIEFPPGFLVNAPEARDLLKRVNADLLAHNMRVIKRLFEIGCPIDPLALPTTRRLRGGNFDLAMVEYEQTEVERMLRTERDQPGFARARQDINRDINLDGDLLRPIGAFMGTWFWTPNIFPMQWAKQYLRVQRLDFMVKAHRVAIGKALVFQLHGFEYGIYEQHMSTGRSPF